MSKPLLIAMMGLPRSGKSTISKELSKKLGAPIVNRDAIRLAVHGQRYEELAEPLIKALDIYMIRSLFGAGHQYVICDETNYSSAARNHLRDDSWDLAFYEVPTQPDICIERAKATNQEDLVPVIEGMWERFEPLDENEWRYCGDDPETNRIIFKKGKYEPELETQKATS